MNEQSHKIFMAVKSLYGDQEILAQLTQSDPITRGIYNHAKLNLERYKNLPDMIWTLLEALETKLEYESAIRDCLVVSADFLEDLERADEMSVQSQ